MWGSGGVLPRSGLRRTQSSKVRLSEPITPLILKGFCGILVLWKKQQWISKTC